MKIGKDMVELNSVEANNDSAMDCMSGGVDVDLTKINSGLSSDQVNKMILIEGEKQAANSDDEAGMSPSKDMLGDGELPDPYKRKAKLAFTTKKMGAESSQNVFMRGGSSIAMASGVE